MEEWKEFDHHVLIISQKTAGVDPAVSDAKKGRSSTEDRPFGILHPNCAVKERKFERTNRICRMKKADKCEREICPFFGR
jgi:hypothetical protein